MIKAAEALSWKNNGLLATFGLRLNNDDETKKSRTTLEHFFDQAQLCALAPWWGWGLIYVAGIARADRNASRPLHLVRAHPQAQYFDFSYAPPGAPWSLLLRAVPWDVVQQAIIEHGIAAVIDDMRRSLATFNRFAGADAPQPNGHDKGGATAPNGHAKRRERRQQTKPNRTFVRR